MHIFLWIVQDRFFPSIYCSFEFVVICQTREIDERAKNVYRERECNTIDLVSWLRAIHSKQCIPFYSTSFYSQQSEVESENKLVCQIMKIKEKDVSCFTLSNDMSISAKKAWQPSGPINSRSSLSAYFSNHFLHSSTSCFDYFCI